MWRVQLAPGPAEHDRREQPARCGRPRHDVVRGASHHAIYVDIEPLKAARAIRSNCAVLRRLIGELPLKALEGKDPVDIVKRAYSGHALSTRNRMLSPQ